MNNESGIYAITSPSGRQYIGQAKCFKLRWWEHLSDLRNGSHHCKGLQNAYAKYGESALVFSVIAIVPPEQLNEREQQEIDLRHRSMLYNTALFVRRPRLGLRHSDESRAKMAAAAKNRPIEYRKKLSAGRIGKIHSAESRLAMSLALSGPNHPNWGKSHSAETLADMIKAQQNRSPEWRARIAAAKTGKPRSAETIAKMSAAMTGKMLGAKNPKSKPVICIDLGLTFVSVKEAGDWFRANGYPTAAVSNISAACRGNIHFAYGFRWKYAGDPDRPPTSRPIPKGENNGASRAVVCAETGIRFGAVSDAVRWLRGIGKSKALASNICDVCREKRATAYGFRWIYTD